MYEDYELENRMTEYGIIEGGCYFFDEILEFELIITNELPF